MAGIETKSDLGNVVVPTASYIGNMGCFDLSFELAGLEPAARRNGIMGRDWGVKMAEVTDGTSNTLLSGETVIWNFSWDPNWLFRINAGGTGAGNTLGALRSAIRRINPSALASQVVRREAFASNHTGGANFGFVDGSVHFISENVDHSNTEWVDYAATPPAVLGTYQKLSSRNDGLVVGEY